MKVTLVCVVRLAHVEGCSLNHGQYVIRDTTANCSPMRLLYTPPVLSV